MPQHFRSVVRRAILWFSIRNRKRKGRAIAAWMKDRDYRTVLLVGTMGDEFAGDPNMSNAGIVERAIADEFEIKMSINIEPAITPYPFMLADARDLPFESDYCDFSLANAIIEHVGGRDDQRRMIEEMSRVSRSWVITTPNRWFPIESHTSAVLAHWSQSWRDQRDEFTRLLSLAEFRELLPDEAVVVGRPWSPTFTAYFECSD